MRVHAEKTRENKSKFLANEPPQRRGVGAPVFQFLDNRPEAVVHGKLQEMANDSYQSIQLKAFQDMADDSPQVEQTAQLQAMADTYSGQPQQPIQKKENKTGLQVNSIIERNSINAGQLGIVQRKISGSAFNMVGESHDKVTRHEEKAYLEKAYGISPDKYWTELEYLSKEKNYAGVQKRADPPIAHVRTQIIGIASAVDNMQVLMALQTFSKTPNVPDEVIKKMELVWHYWESAYGGFILFYTADEDAEIRKHFALDPDEEKRMVEATKIAEPIHEDFFKLRWWVTGKDTFLTKKRRVKAILNLLKKLHLELRNLDAKMGGGDAGALDGKAVMDERNVAMMYAASQAGQNGETGVWKVGEEHVENLIPLEDGFLLRGSNVNLTQADDFKEEMENA